MSERYDTLVGICRMAQLGASTGFPQQRDATDLADALISFFRASLLSDEAIRAGALAITQDPNFGDNTWFDDARNVLTAALDAAGLKGTDDAHDR